MPQARTAEDLLSQLRSVQAIPSFKLEAPTDTCLRVTYGDKEWMADIALHHDKPEESLWPIGVRVVVAGKPHSVWTKKVMGEAKYALLRLLQEHQQVAPLVHSLLDEIRHRIDQGPLAVQPSAFPLVNVMGIPQPPSVVEQVGAGKDGRGGTFPIRMRSS